VLPAVPDEGWEPKGTGDSKILGLFGGSSIENGKINIKGGGKECNGTVPDRKAVTV